ncbi:MAG: NitT/TauT family transport system permease protein [Acidimicrobiaceae bacterium]|jgi:NitT/TauT family transport system permease protein|nr:NitT/TauT family transport system permease protein [Acidimicrobiaceae bacterium]
MSGLSFETVQAGTAIAASTDDSPPPSSRARRSSRRASDYIGLVVVFGFFIGAWYLLSKVILPKQKRFLLPTPNKVIREAFLDWSRLKPILTAVEQSAKVALVGLVITIAVGIGLATVMSMARWVERSIWPYLVAIQAAPILALTPLISGLLGFAFKSRVLVAVLISFFPVVNNTLFGLLSVDRSHHELFTLQGANRWTRLRKLQFPAALPNIFVGLRNAAGLSVIGAVVGDFYFRQGGQVGIGAQIDVYRQRLRGSEMIASIILAALLGLSVFVFFGWLGRRATGRWHTDTRGN